MDKENLEERLRYMVPEVRLIMLKESGVIPLSIHDPRDLELYVEPMKYYSEEHFVALHLDVKYRVTGYHIVARGTLTESLVHPRELFKAVMLNNASSVIVAHNHPAGSLTPSREDIMTTKMLIKAGAILGIPLLDHVIVSTEGIVSLRDTHSTLWSK